MPYVIIEDFSGGLDSRRLSVAASPGTLMELVNAHITRGGEIEKRKAFVSTYDLPSGTKGLASVKSDIYVFGSDVEPAGLPSGVKYQRLQAPGGPDLTKVLSWDTYAGKLYVSAEFSDGTVHHFYDEDRIVNWFDGVSRGSLTVNFTDTKAGSESTVDIPKFEIGSEELQVQVFLTDPDGESKLELTDSFTVDGAGGATDADYRDLTAFYINQKTSTTNVSAADISGPGLRLTYDDKYTDRKDWRVSFDVTVTGELQASVSAEAQGSSTCSSDGGDCTVIFDLECTATGGTTPYTFAWTIVDDGGGDSVSLSSSSGSTTQLSITNSVSASCEIIEVTVKCEVTDDAGTVVSDTETVSSSHCNSSVS